MLKYLEIDALLHRLMAAVDQGELSGSVDVQGEQVGPLFPAEDVVGIEVAIFKLHELVEAAEQEDVAKVGRVLSAKTRASSRRRATCSAACSTRSRKRPRSRTMAQPRAPAR